ncbi:hypothetical protein [Sagittula sp.]|uniref:hypothetical protein n=1 Tax=Sagittula sp. TaxID=2038081 RepID=UPI0040598068
MKASIATFSMTGTLRGKLAATAKAGFDGIEIFEKDSMADVGRARDIGAMIRDH